VNLLPPLAVVAAVLGSTVVAATDDAPRDVEGDRVLLVGDSIFFQTREELAAALEAAGWDPRIAAIPATTVRDWAGEVDDLLAEHQPDVVVLELGTNEDVDRLRLAPDIARVLRALDGVDRVVWLNVQEDADYPRGADAINHLLESAVVWASNAEVLDFSGHFAGHPEWHALEPEGVHMSVSGERELARFVAAALGRAAPS
jgi:lysophospholipase L1-like esterase